MLGKCSLLCTIWAILCRLDFSLEDFGVQIRPVRTFLHRLRTIPGTSVALAFPDLLRQAASSRMPRDVGEFVSELVTWLETEAVSMTWERRFLAGSKVERSESGSWQYPISLDCMYELDISAPTMSQLLQPWVYAESMHSAFLSIGTLKCIHIDRALMLAPLLGHNNLLELEDTVDLPFFEHARTHDIRWLPYVPVSGVVHLGSRNSGHFITFVKAWNPKCWYELDDGKPAKTHRQLPDWAKRRLVLIWLCPAPYLVDSSAPSLDDMCPLTPSRSETLHVEDQSRSWSTQAEDTDSIRALDATWPENGQATDQQQRNLLLSRIAAALEPSTPAAAGTSSGATHR